MQLNTLQRVELIREAARVPELEYIFRHELTRDAAYGTILRRQRRQFHLQVAETIEELFPDKLEEEAHRLGYHFAQARENERALRYYTLAAEAAARLYANREAADHYKEAIKFAQKVGVSIEDLNDLYMKGGRALELSGGYEEAIGLYKELEQMGEEQDEPAMVLAALTPQATIASVPTEQYDAEHSKALTDRALKLARELKDPRAEAKALWNKMLVSYFIEGNSQLSLEYGEKAQVIAREHGLKEELAYTLHDSVRPYMSIGDVEKARTAQAEALALWQEMGNLPMTADNLTMASTNAYYQANFTEALELGEEALRISQNIDSLWGQAYSKGNIAPVYYEMGEIGKAMNSFQESAALAKEANFMAAQFSNLYLALILADLGAFEDAQEYTDKAGKWVSGGEMTMGRYVRALDAFILARKGEADEAWKSLDSALDDFEDLNLEAVENVLVEPIKVEVALINRDFEKVMELTQAGLESPKLRGFRLLHPKMLYLRSKALFEQGKTDQAYLALEEAREIAQGISMRMSLWRIHGELSRHADASGDREAAEAHRQKAREVIKHIAEQIDSDDLRAEFLGSKDVIGIMD
jgi:tetratricopeptide (TPR) repeat protein